MHRRRPQNPGQFVVRLVNGIAGVPVYLAIRDGGHCWTKDLRHALTFATTIGADMYVERRRLGACEVVAVSVVGRKPARGVPLFVVARSP
jgi:hypothetical protein